MQLLQLLLVKILIRNARGRRPARDGRGCQFDFSCWIFLTFAFSVINKKPFPVLFFENVEQPRKSIPAVAPNVPPRGFVCLGRKVETALKKRCCELWVATCVKLCLQASRKLLLWDHYSLARAAFQTSCLNTTLNRPLPRTCQLSGAGAARVTDFSRPNFSQIV